MSNEETLFHAFMTSRLDYCKIQQLEFAQLDIGCFLSIKFILKS